MTDLPIQLTLKTVSTKVAPAAWDRVDALAAQFGARKSDIVSACLLFMPEAEIKRVLDEQAAAMDALPKPVRGLLRHIDKLDAKQRQLVIEALSGPRDK